MKLSNNTKTVIIINIYRLLVSSSGGVYCCLTQYNKIDGKAKLTKEYRKEIFQEIEDYIKRNNDITDIIIARDMNQSIASNEI